MVKESIGQGLGAGVKSEGKRTLMLVFFGANDGAPPIYSMLCVWGGVGAGVVRVCVCVCVCIYALIQSQPAATAPDYYMHVPIDE